MIVKVDPFVSGTLIDGSLELIREAGSAARCGVIMCTGTMTDNEDGTLDLDLGE